MTRPRRFRRRSPSSRRTAFVCSAPRRTRPAARETMNRLDDLEAKKQLLIAQAEFDRLKFAMAVHDVRRIVRPPRGTSGPAGVHSTASRLLGSCFPCSARLASGAWFARCRSRCRSIGCYAAGRPALTRRDAGDRSAFAQRIGKPRFGVVPWQHDAESRAFARVRFDLDARIEQIAQSLHDREPDSFARLLVQGPNIGLAFEARGRADRSVRAFPSFTCEAS